MVLLGIGALRGSFVGHGRGWWYQEAAWGSKEARDRVSHQAKFLTPGHSYALMATQAAMEKLTPRFSANVTAMPATV